MEISPRIITIAFDEVYEGLTPIRFEFIEEKERMVDGVKISEDIQFEED